MIGMQFDLFKMRISEVKDERVARDQGRNTVV